MFLFSIHKRLIYTPIGIKLGFKPFRNKKAPANDILEDAFINNRSRFSKKQVILIVITQLHF